MGSEKDTRGLVPLLPAVRLPRLTSVTRKDILVGWALILSDPGRDTRGMLRTAHPRQYDAIFQATVQLRAAHDDNKQTNPISRRPTLPLPRHPSHKTRPTPTQNNHPAGPASALSPPPAYHSQPFPFTWATRAKKPVTSHTTPSFPAYFG